MSSSATPRTAACQASLSFTSPWSLLRFVSIESVMLLNYLTFGRPLLFLPSIFSSFRTQPLPPPRCQDGTTYSLVSLPTFSTLRGTRCPKATAHLWANGRIVFPA